MLSRRGAGHAAAYKLPPEGLLGNNRRPSDGGVVDFSNAINCLMAGEMRDWIRNKGSIPLEYMHYNEGFDGSQRLKSAMCKFLNRTMNPVLPITNDAIHFVGGVTALNSILATLLTDPGEAILLGRPIYGSFHTDLVAETDTRLVHTSFSTGIDQFAVEAVDCYRRAVIEARMQGIEIRALMIANPHNPLGACYAPAALQALMKLCEEFRIHIISDEVYAQTVFETGDAARPGFTSVLALNTPDVIDPDLVHVMYGTSKDFAAAGLRSGCLISRNQDLNHAVRRIARFHAPAEICSAYIAAMLEDEEFVDGFLEESRRRLAKNYALATGILTEAGINYFRRGNAGFFLWVDLSPFLDQKTDGWEAERALGTRFQQALVFMAGGEAYAAETPGWFRVIFSTPEDVLREGLRRIISIVKEQV